MIHDEKYIKRVRTPSYNFDFDKRTGFFARWGKTEADDPDFSPMGPEILDLEISSGGDCKGHCKFCYKCNGGDQPTHNMTFEEFKIIFHKMPSTLTQIAFGIMDISTNPSFFRMMLYARQYGVIPNYTCHGLDVTSVIAKMTSLLCGAVSVSIVDKEISYEAIRMFLKEKMQQVNIHYMLSEESYDRAFSVVDDLSSDPTLQGFNAIVFLQYKSKGRSPDQFHSVLSVNKYKTLVNYCDSRGIRYGFDSCSASLYLEGINGSENYDQIKTCVEPCESGLFSSYINCHGKFFVCSFAENEDEWVEGLDVLNCKNFLDDIWNHPRLVLWRDRLLRNKRECPIYDLSFSKNCLKRI